MNRICIEPTKFVNVRTGEESLGFRAYDDYGQCYDNTFDKIPDDDLEFLELALKSSDDETLWAMIDFFSDGDHSINIGTSSYSWEEIEPIVKRVQDK